MKKRIALSVLLALLFAAPVFAGIIVDETNFPDQGFREVLIKHEMYSAEYNVIVYPDVTKIDCEKNQTVKDLTGLTIFENLEELNCWTCPIQTLNLSGNPKLSYLDVCETKLTTLDVTKNPELKQLWAYGNAITVLDLSKCPYLSKAVKNGIYNNDKNGGQSYAFADDATDSYVVVDKKVKILLDDGTSVGPAAGYEESSGTSGGDSTGSTSSSQTTSQQTASTQSSAEPAVIIAAINAANFPDAGFRAVVKTFDTDNDNRLSSEEIENATTINCSGRNISSLNGIEYFTELRSLNCSSNKLKTLDISRNSSLNYLNCRSNEITQLDVSGALCLRAAVWKGRNTVSESNYDYFKDPHYMNVTIYSHGAAGGTNSIDLSYYLLVDRFVTVKAGGVTNKASVEPPASLIAASGTSSSGTGEANSDSAASAAVTVSNGKYKLSGSVAVLTSPKNKSITKITLPTTVKIGGKARKVTKISANAFKGCTKLTTVTIGKNVTSIGAGAFSGCKNLTKVVIGAGVKSIGKNAFLNCVKLKTVSGGKSLTTIGTAAFSGCKTLTKITLYGKVKKIGAKAFYKCSKLKTITIKTSKLTFKQSGQMLSKEYMQKLRSRYRRRNSRHTRRC